jgi:hypothetical protein
MNKQTPGPWFQDKYGNVMTQSGSTLVTDGVALGSRSTDETKANARLIAAAPELLEALKSLLNYANLGAYQRADTVKAARAAIAKAEGGAA